MGTGSFPGVKRPGRGADHPPPSKCRGHDRVELYLYSPSGPSWPVKGAPLPLLKTKLKFPDLGQHKPEWIPSSTHTYIYALYAGTVIASVGTKLHTMRTEVFMANKVSDVRRTVHDYYSTT